MHSAPDGRDDVLASLSREEALDLAQKSGSVRCLDVPPRASSLASICGRMRSDRVSALDCSLESAHTLPRLLQMQYTLWVTALPLRTRRGHWRVAMGAPRCGLGTLYTLSY